MSDRNKNKDRDRQNRYSKSLPTHMRSGFDLLKQHQQERQNTVINDDTMKNWDITDINRVAPNAAPLPAVWVHENRHIFPDRTEVPLTNPIEIDQQDYRIFHFESTHNTAVNVNNKVVKMSFVDCTNLEVNLNANVFGTLDFIRCKDVVVNINAIVNTVQIDLCCNVTFNQYIDEVVYVGQTCMDTVVNYKVGSSFEDDGFTIKHILPITMFSDQTYCFVTQNGVQSYTIPRPLNKDTIYNNSRSNKITMNVMFK